MQSRDRVLGDKPFIDPVSFFILLIYALSIRDSQPASQPAPPTPQPQPQPQKKPYRLAGDRRIDLSKVNQVSTRLMHNMGPSKNGPKPTLRCSRTTTEDETHTTTRDNKRTTTKHKTFMYGTHTQHIPKMQVKLLECNVWYTNPTQPKTPSHMIRGGNIRITLSPHHIKQAKVARWAHLSRSKGDDLCMLLRTTEP